MARFLLMVLLLTLTACVTINVYFPAAQAERAAEKIVDEILGEPSGKSSENPQGSYLYQQKHWLAYMGDFFISPANAQPNFNVNTPDIRRLKSSMADRHGQLASFYNKGAIGFTNNGLVAIRDKGALSIRERGAVNGLIKAENNDRNSLYRAIAAANNNPGWESDVRAVFASKWVQKARSGWWYQNAKGAWTKK